MRKRRSYPTDLTDAEWEIVEPLIPKPQRRGPKENVDVREILNGIFYFLHEGWGGERCLTTCHLGQRFPIISVNGKEKAFGQRYKKHYALACEKNKDEPLNPVPP